MLDRLRQRIQIDVGGRQQCSSPGNNLFSACPEDFSRACESIASRPHASLAIVTGFFIPNADPPAAETDGPLGAIYLARALAPIGMRVGIFAEDYCRRALGAGLDEVAMRDAVTVRQTADCHPSEWSHVIALERVGPSHTASSVQAQTSDVALQDRFRSLVPETSWDRCKNARGRDVTQWSGAAHRLFEQKGSSITIGIGDGGNEIGMGKLPWSLIADCVPNGAAIACRVPTDYLIVAGVSNWGAYALAAGVRYLKGIAIDPALHDVDLERRILERMVRDGPLVDGITGKRDATVDGLSFEAHARPLAS